MKTIAIILLLLTASCKNEGKEPSTAHANNLKSGTNHNQKQEKYINIQETKGQTPEQLKQKYKPIHEEDFYLNKGPITEFRIGLYNFFNEQERQKPILIKEITWQQNPLENYTIWFKKKDNNWIAIDAYTWNKYAVF